MLELSTEVGEGLEVGITIFEWYNDDGEPEAQNLIYLQDPSRTHSIVGLTSMQAMQLAMELIELTKHDMVNPVKQVELLVAIEAIARDHHASAHDGAPRKGSSLIDGTNN